MNTLLAAKNFGLKERDLNTLLDILSQNKEITEVWLFGSRAKGCFTYKSDIDIAIMNDGVTKRTLFNFKNQLAESSLPYMVDVLVFNEISNSSLKEHILRVGRELYKSN